MLLTLLAAAAVQIASPPAPPSQVVPVGPAARCPNVKPMLTPVADSTRPVLDSEPLRVIVGPYNGPAANALDREPLRNAPHTLGAEPDAAHCLAKPAGQSGALSR